MYQLKSLLATTPILGRVLRAQGYIHNVVAMRNGAFLPVSFCMTHGVHVLAGVMACKRKGNSDVAESAPEAKRHKAIFACSLQGNQPDTMLAAVARGDLPSLELLWEAGVEPMTMGIITAAAEHKQVACLRYLVRMVDGHHNICKKTRRRSRTQCKGELHCRTPYEAAPLCRNPDKGGLLSQTPSQACAGLLYRAQFGLPRVPADVCVQSVCGHLAGLGNLTGLQTLVEARCEKFMDHHTLFAAARSGSAECVRYVAPFCSSPELSSFSSSRFVITCPCDLSRPAC